MQVRCPHCNSPIDLASDGELSDIACPSCGSSFSLLGTDETAPFRPAETRTIGHFELVEQVGVGTFGAVWRAKDVDLDREVAVKIPRKSQLDALESEQFLREARAAAQLRHPGIVAVHEVGREQDTVYIVSDLIEGVTLADCLTAQKFSAREAAQLCAKIAEPLQHAHDAGVYHRDLKTGNIMLDADGEPHILDFGLARRESGDVTMTVEGRVLGTPAYLSPEQALGAAHVADARSDIYSLGVILFELLTGERPFRGNIRMLIHQVINEEAPSPRRLNGNVPRDLETICLKCLEKDPDKRYQTAGSLAEELRRFLRGEPINARPVGRLEKAWRWCRRYPLVSGLATALVLSLITGVLGFGWLWQNAAKRAEETRRLLYTSDMNAAQLAWQANNTERVDRLLRRHDPAPPLQDLRRFEWYYLWALGKEAREEKPIKLSHKANSVAFSPKSNTLAVGQYDGLITLWNADRRSKIGTIKGAEGGFYGFVTFSPDARTIAYPSKQPGRVALTDLGTKETKELGVESSPVNCAVFFDQGARLAVGDEDGQITIWDWKNNLEVERHSHSVIVESMAVSPNGKQLAIGGRCAEIVIKSLDRAADDIILEPTMVTLPNGIATSKSFCWVTAFSSDGDLLAAGYADGTVRVWDLKEHNEIALVGHDDEVRSVAFSPDGAVLASGSRDNTIRLWDTNDLTLKATLKGHWSAVQQNCLAFSPDGKILASGSADYTLRLWQTDSLDRPQHRWADMLNTDVAYTLDGSVVVTLFDGMVRVWSPGDNVSPIALKSESRIRSFAVNDNGLIATCHTGESQVSLWDVKTQNKLASLECVKDPQMPVFSFDGQKLAVGCGDYTIRVWDVTSRKLDCRLSAHTDSICCLAFAATSPLRLASSSRDGTIKLWDMATEKQINEYKGDTLLGANLAFSRDGKTLASGGEDGAIRLWHDLSSKEYVTIGRAHSISTRNVMFLDDDATLLSLGSDRSMKLWDYKTGIQRFSFTGHRQALEKVACSPDGLTLVTIGRFGETRIRQAASEGEVKASGWYED